MPVPLNLTGRRFGALTVIEVGPSVIYGGTAQRSWHAACSCGRHETYPQKRLTSGRVTACSVCSQPKCERCGQPFERASPSQRFCEDCAPENRRRQFRESYYRRRTADPEGVAHKARAARMKRMATDPEAERARQRANQRLYRERVRADTERLDRVRAYDRAWKQAQRDLLRLDPVEYESWLARNREAQRAYQREWRRRWRESLTAEGREAQREYHRERRRQAALAELLQIVGGLNKDQ